MEQIPIIIDGKTCGQLRLRREGAYMVCSGQARYDGEMLRLWLYGGGERGYLGVLLPDGTVRKKFSLSDFAKLPTPIEYCGPEAQCTPRPTEDTEDILWVRRSDGTLIRFDGRYRYIAFPADEVRLPRGGRFVLRNIEGRDYVVFPY